MFLFNSKDLPDFVYSRKKCKQTHTLNLSYYTLSTPELNEEIGNFRKQHQTGKYNNFAIIDCIYFVNMKTRWKVEMKLKNQKEEISQFDFIFMYAKNWVKSTLFSYFALIDLWSDDVIANLSFPVAKALLISSHLVRVYKVIESSSIKIIFQFFLLYLYLFIANYYRRL